MKDASLIVVRYVSSKYYVRNYVTTNTLLRIVALKCLNEIRSSLRPLSYNVEGYILLHITHTQTKIQKYKQTNEQKDFLPDAHPGVGLGARPRIIFSVYKYGK